jgi:hypothetical protein
MEYGKQVQDILLSAETISSVLLTVADTLSRLPPFFSRQIEINPGLTTRDVADYRLVPRILGTSLSVAIGLGDISALEPSCVESRASHI